MPRDLSMILIIEDEEDVRELVEAVLATQNEVLSAATLEAAEVHWRTRHDEIDLVLSDLQLPGGAQAPTVLGYWQQEKPDLRVVFMSGLSSDHEAAGVRLVEGTNFLPKPFTTGELLRIASTQGSHKELDLEVAQRAAA